MKEYWVRFRLKNGHDSLVILPSKAKLFWWILRHLWYCDSIKITVMWDA